MKNIVKVLRFKDNAARLYALPEGVTVEAGTLVSVEYPTMFSTTVGTTVSASYTVDGDIEKMAAEFHRMPSLDTLKKVVSIYDETRLDWPVDEDPDEDELEVESDDARDD